jgi:hypothetical protein
LPAYWFDEGFTKINRFEKALEDVAARRHQFYLPSAVHHNPAISPCVSCAQINLLKEEDKG